MPHDIDHNGAYFAHRDANVPEPNFIAINAENGHGHSAMLLAVPVARHDAARFEPLHFYGAVERGIARRIGAAGESCRAIGRTMGVHHATIARLAA